MSQRNRANRAQSVNLQQGRISFWLRKPEEKQFSLAGSKLNADIPSDGELAVVCKGRKSRRILDLFYMRSRLFRKTKEENIKHPTG